MHTLTPIPASYLGLQEFPGHSSFELWTIWQGIDGHPYGSSVSTHTLTDAGYCPFEAQKGTHL